MWRRRRSSERGFTLVELMVVMAIIGLGAGVAVLTMPDARGDLKTDAERFAARVRGAQDAAVIEARDIALTLRPDGYSFSRYSSGRWVPIATKPFAPQRWAEGTQAIVGDGGTARVTFDTTGSGTPVDVVLVRDEQSVRIHVGGDGTVRVGA
ncbi:MAG: ral secretion pathway protein [Sphingomonas bacterium]|nr:type II secretion system minor pseudopilin GspH [Sphingomonas bacterium]MDB5688364.1 ral secretion pathway protein [Sphingomonas bacterium]